MRRRAPARARATVGARIQVSAPSSSRSSGVRATRQPRVTYAVELASRLVARLVRSHRRVEHGARAEGSDGSLAIPLDAGTGGVAILRAISLSARLDRSESWSATRAPARRSVALER